MAYGEEIRAASRTPVPCTGAARSPTWTFCFRFRVKQHRRVLGRAGHLQRRQPEAGTNCALYQGQLLHGRGPKALPRALRGARARATLEGDPELPLHHPLTEETEQRRIGDLLGVLLGEDGRGPARRE
jgi:hypothetical protein